MHLWHSGQTEATRKPRKQGRKAVALPPPKPDLQRYTASRQGGSIQSWGSAKLSSPLLNPSPHAAAVSVLTEAKPFLWSALQRERPGPALSGLELLECAGRRRRSSLLLPHCVCRRDVLALGVEPLAKEARLRQSFLGGGPAPLELPCFPSLMSFRQQVKMGALMRVALCNATYNICIVKSFKCILWFVSSYSIVVL